MGLDQMSDTITRAIVRVIAATTPLSREAVALGEGDDLYEAGLKSLAAVHLMLALEEEFGIEFPDSVLHRNAFSTIEHIRGIIAPLLVRGSAHAK
jgi:acyl carrier protein